MLKITLTGNGFFVMKADPDLASCKPVRLSQASGARVICLGSSEDFNSCTVKMKISPRDLPADTDFVELEDTIGQFTAAGTEYVAGIGGCIVGFEVTGAEGATNIDVYVVTSQF